MSETNLPGMEAGTKVAILGARFATEEEFALGEKVTLRISGHVVMTGEEVEGTEGVRRVVKIAADVITPDR